jgi:hypothetical protein
VLGSPRVRLLGHGRPAAAGTRRARAAAGRWALAADARALAWSESPRRALGLLLGANLALGAVGVGAGAALAGDPALYFRELAPGTWLSAAQIVAAAVVARAIHLRHRDDGARRWHQSLWGLAAVMLAGLAVVELAQPTVFAGKWLQSELGVRARSGIADVDAVLVVTLLVALLLILLPHARALFEHPRALLLLGAGFALGAASQALDSLWPVSDWEFVVEDGLKLLAEPFVLAGLLVVLASRREATR